MGLRGLLGAALVAVLFVVGGCAKPLPLDPNQYAYHRLAERFVVVHWNFQEDGGTVVAEGFAQLRSPQEVDLHLSLVALDGKGQRVGAREVAARLDPNQNFRVPFRIPWQVTGKEDAYTLDLRYTVVGSPRGK